MYPIDSKQQSLSTGCPLLRVAQGLLERVTRLAAGQQLSRVVVDVGKILLVAQEWLGVCCFLPDPR